MRDIEAFIAFLEAREAWLFGYGPEALTHDCARFFSAGIAAATGYAPLDHFTSQWTTRRGAMRVIAAHGGLATAVNEVMTPIAPTMAQRGDGGLTVENTLVLVEGEMIIGLNPDRGLFRQPRAALNLAWTAPLRTVGP